MYHWVWNIHKYFYIVYGSPAQLCGGVRNKKAKREIKNSNQFRKKLAKLTERQNWKRVKSETLTSSSLF